MATFFVNNSNQVGFLNAAVPATAEFRGGVLSTADAVNSLATTGGGLIWSNGLVRINTGRVRIFDATAGLPADVQWTNGLPMRSSTGAICYSTNAMATYSNGIPFDAAGAVCAVVT